MGINIIHTGDIHIGREFKNFDKEFANIRQIEIKNTFLNILDIAQKEKVDFLLIAGDIFDNNYTTVAELKEIGNRLGRMQDINIIICAGNHDPIIDRTSNFNVITWPDNVYIFNEDNDRFVFEDKNTIIWGYSWNGKEIEKSKYDSIHLDEEYINIFMVHGDVNLSCNPFSRDNLGRFDYVALGHIHKHSIGDKIVYCGSPEPLDFGELGEHGIVEVAVSKYSCRINHRPIAKREYIISEIDIDETMMMGDIVSSINQLDDEISRQNNMYRVIIKGTRDRDIYYDIDEIKSQLVGYCYIELIDNTRLDYDLDKLEIDNHDNIIGMFIREMKKKDLSRQIVKEALYKGLDMLLEEKVSKY